MNAKTEPWKLPKWAEPYRAMLRFNGWEPEEYMNCDGGNCNIFVNGPRALMCATAVARLNMLFELHNAGWRARSAVKESSRG